METTIALGILHHRVCHTATLLVKQTALCFKLRLALCEVIVIDKVVTCVVWRVDINHLYLTQIVLTEQLQHLQVITFDIEVLGIVEIHTLLTARTQCLIRWCISQADSSTLIWPSELITLLCTLDNLARQLLTQLVEVDSFNEFAFIIYFFSKT